MAKVNWELYADLMARRETMNDSILKQLFEIVSEMPTEPAIELLTGLHNDLEVLTDAAMESVRRLRDEATKKT